MSVSDWNKIIALAGKKLGNLCVFAGICDNLKTDYQVTKRKIFKMF